MKKKNIIILIFLIIAILIISIFLVINNRVLSREDDIISKGNRVLSREDDIISKGNSILSTEDDIISKGNRIFGTDYCTKKNNDHPMMAGQAITPYKCKICNKEYEHPDTATPKICSSCADITGRCMQCGKLEKVSEQ